MSSVSEAMQAPAAPAQAGGRALARARRRLDSMAVWLELIRNLAVRDIETRYKHSLLGLYWAVINPLVTAGIFGFVFAVIFKASSKPIPYVVFLLTGLTFWNFFANGIMSATGSITGSAALLAKIYFPRLVLPAAAAAARIIDLGFSAFVLAVFIAAYRVPVHWSVWAVVPLCLLQGIFTLALSALVSALNVLYRDVAQLIGLVLMVWMYLSPVMYAVTGQSTVIQSILLLNPMGAILQAERDVIFTGFVTDWPYLWAALGWTLFALVGGLAVFKRVEPLFAEVL